MCALKCEGIKSKAKKTFSSEWWYSVVLANEVTGSWDEFQLFLWFLFVHCLRMFGSETWFFLVRSFSPMPIFKEGRSLCKRECFFFVFFCSSSDWFQCKLLACLVMKIGPICVKKNQVLIYFWEKYPSKASQAGLILAGIDLVLKNKHFFFYKPYSQINREQNLSCWKCRARLWEDAYSFVTTRSGRIVGFSS